VWQANDTVQLAFPLFVQVSRLQDNQNAVAFTYGPIVLSAGLGTASMTTTSHGVQVLKATMPSGIQDTITINSGTAINTWIGNIKTNLVQTAGKLEFTLKNTDSDSKLSFVPHFSRYLDRYGIYFKLAGTAGGSVPDAGVCPAGGTGGAPGSGGATGGGGSSGAPDAAANTGGRSGSGGVAGADASSGNGGRGGAGGSTDPGLGGSGGARTGSGGAAGIAGAGGAGAATGGSGGSATSAGNGGAAGGSGGAKTGAGGTVGTSGGSSGNPTGGTAGGCSCNMGRPMGRTQALGVLLALGLVAWRRSTRRKQSRAETAYGQVAAPR
jgi:hypothetical protein